MKDIFTAVLLSVSSVTSRYEVVSQQSTACTNPSPVPHGTWHCSSSSSCHLECAPGFAASPRSLLRCDGELWTSGAPSASCQPAVLVIADGDSNQVQLYSPRIRDKDLPTLPDYPKGRYGGSREFAGLVYADDALVLCGGEEDGTDGVKTCIQLCCGKTWTQHSTRTRHFLNPVNLVHNSEMLVLGTSSRFFGNGDAFRFEEHHWFSYEEEHWYWEEHHAFTKDLYITSTCAVKTSPDKVVLMGGGETKNKVQTSKLVIELNLVTGAARTLAEMDTARMFFGCAPLTSEYGDVTGIIVSGGTTMRCAIWSVSTLEYIITDDINNCTDTVRPEQALSSVEIYDIKSGTWNYAVDLQQARYGHSMATMADSSVLAIGGKDSEDSSLSSVEMFKNGAWSPARDLSKPVYAHAVASVPESYLRFKDRTIYGMECGSPCAQQGYSYFWCDLTGGSWDYCSPDSDHTRYGEECSSQHYNCAQRGESYYWCKTLDGTWDYCSPCNKAPY